MQAFPREEYEVVVVADGCTDDTVQFLQSYASRHLFRWLSQPNQGQPAAQNTGIGVARGEIVILMDDDCICDAGLVAAHYEMHQGGERVVAIGVVLLHPDSPASTLRDLKNEVEDKEFARLSSHGARKSDLMLCANSSIERQAALDCPFDPTYKRMHDVEAGLRLGRKGYRPRMCAGAVTYELFTKSVAGVLSDSRYQGQYEVLLTEKYPEFKPITALVRINEGSPLKRWLRKQMAARAGASELLLRAVCWLTEPLGRHHFFSWIASRALRARFGVQHLRGAIAATGSWKELERRFGVRTPVLIYHNVGQPRPEEYPGLTTPTSEFEAQIIFLAKMGYHSILPSDWLRWRDLGGSLPERPLMLVFDDGYEEICDTAFPILERYGFGAACMLVTGCIGSTNRWDEEAGRPSIQLMSIEQILDWSQRHIEFGGHTSHHPELTLESDERIEQEVAQCKQDLGTLLGKEAVSFAYPFGSFNVSAEEAVSRHFQMGFTSWPGRLHLATNPCLIPRIAFLPGESHFGMWCRLRLGRNPFEVLRNRWRRLIGSGRQE